MGIVQRQGLINSIISYTGIVIGFVNIAYLFPRFFTPEHLGLRSVLFEFSLVLAQFSTFGFTGITNKYFPYYHNENGKEKGFLTFVLTVPAIGFSILVLIILLFRDQLFLSFQDRTPLLSEYYYLILVIGFFTLQSMILEIYSAFFNPAAGSFFREVFQRLFTTFLIFTYVLGLINIHQFWLWFTASFAFSFAGLFTWLIYQKAVSVSFNFRFLDRVTLRQMTSFGLFGLLNSAASMIVMKIDVIMIVYILKDLSLTGIYALAIYMASVIEIPKKALGQITNPLLSRAYMENNHSIISAIYQKTSINQLIAGGFIFLGIWTNIDELLSLIPKGEIFTAGKYSILFLGLAKIIDMGTGVNGEIISYSKFYRYNLYFVITLALIGIILNFIFIPLFGITGSAVGTAISYLIFNILKYIFIYRKMQMQPFTRNYLITFALFCVTLIMMSLVSFPFLHPIVSILVKGILLITIFILPVLLLKLSPDMNQLVSRVLKIRI
jgi:O-antigen/teichoic acid export membrane protein